MERRLAAGAPTARQASYTDCRRSSAAAAAPRAAESRDYVGPTAVSESSARRSLPANRRGKAALARTKRAHASPASNRPTEWKQLDLARADSMARRELVPVWEPSAKAGLEVRPDGPAPRGQQSADESEAMSGPALRLRAAPAQPRIYPAAVQPRQAPAPGSLRLVSRAALRRRLPARVRSLRLHAHEPRKTLLHCRWARVQNALAACRLRPRRWSWSA